MNFQQEYHEKKLLLLAGVILLVASFLWAFWPIFWGLVQTWYNDEDYSHGFFVIPVVLYLIWQKKDLWKPTDSALNWLGFVSVLFGIACLFVGLLAQFRSLANISILIALWGSLLFLAGACIFSYAWELSTLIFMLPIPSRTYAALTLPLQLVVTKMAAILLQILGIPVFREGNLLHLTNTSLEVVNACSGLRSILTIILLSYIISCLHLNKSYQRVLLIILAIPLAMLANLIRVTVLALFAHHCNETFINGSGHTILGLVLFVFSFLLLLLLSRAMTCFSSGK